VTADDDAVGAVVRLVAAGDAVQAATLRVTNMNSAGPVPIRSSNDVPRETRGVFLRGLSRAKPMERNPTTLG
jgi:hypothetical protein